MTIHTMQAAEQYAAEHGIALTAADRQRITDAQRAELDRLRTINATSEAVASAAPGWLAVMVQRFNAIYPKFLEFLVRVAEILLTLAQTLIVAFGVPAVLVLLLVVEHQRVLHGIMLFETDHALASFAALALVVTNLVLEFTIHYVESEAGYHQELSSRGSLRIWAHNFGYWLGLGKRWTPIEQSPAQRYRALLRLVTFTILALALAGSMQSVVASKNAAWHVALLSVITDSKLSELMTWAGGLLFAGAAVLSAQGLSRYVALRTAQIIGNMATTASAAQPVTDAQRFESEIDQAGAQVIVALVNAKLQKQQQKDKPAPGAAVPFGSSAATQVDHVRIQQIDLQPMPSAPAHTGNGNGNGKHHDQQ